MREFGLTGGIGSGKSTVSSLLADRGATIIDADAIVRRLQLPGELVFDAMVDRWGSDILLEDGSLDRASVGGIVFSDPDELEALNAIVHPAVAAETARMVDAVSASDAVVIHDIPLLVLPGGELMTSRDHQQWVGIIVIDTPEELAIERVMSARSMDRDAVVARMEAQASRADRQSVADFVVDNSGDLDNLSAEVDRLWNWITTSALQPDCTPQELADDGRDDDHDGKEVS